MVQTYEQYITIYLALNEVFKAPIKVDNMVEFFNKTQKARKNTPVNQNPLHNEFQSFTDRKHFIVTKYQSKENAVDLLGLLSDHESETVISMQQLCDIKSVKVWLPSESSSVYIPPFTLHHRTKSRTDVITHEIQIVHDEAEVRTVMVVEPEVEIQRSGSYVGTFELRSLVSTVLHLKTKQPVTILSSDGVSLCGLFNAVHNVIQEINMDDTVDVFTAVRQLQIRRPEFCAKFEDYETIYQAVMDHYENSSENIYYNQ